MNHDRPRMRGARSVVMKRERIQSPVVASILGVTTNTVRDMAARGELPTAARIGRRWTFNEAAIRRWLQQQEITVQSIASISRSPLSDAALDRAYEEAIGLNRPGVIRYRERMARKAKERGD
jgi:excisionase family DNA binding protein